MFVLVTAHDQKYKPLADLTLTKNKMKLLYETWIQITLFG